MFWTALILFGLAIASWRFTQHHPDEVGRSLGSLSMLISLLMGVVTAPLTLKVALLVGVLILSLNVLSPELEP